MSSQYLADVVMPPTSTASLEETPTLGHQAQEEQTPEDIPEGEPPPPASEIAEEVSYESEEDDSSDMVPEPVRKQKIPQDEIFTPPKVKTILDPDSLKEDKVLHSIASKKPKQTRKKRGPATPEQLERLARGRAKAQETRERKKKEKEEALAKQKADKDLVEAVREKERKKMRKKLEEPDDEPTAVKVVEKPVVVEKGYSQQDLDEAVARAVEQSVAKVETLRKNRKAEKQKAQAKAKHEAQVFKDINTALKNDVWAQCFL
jgi:hypothetical protein